MAWNLLLTPMENGNMLPDVTVPTLDQANQSLGATYDPQVQAVQSQIAQLQPQQDAQQASLDQAKVNAFRDITSSANSKGMLFSGFTPDQQARYIGTKYLPAVANLQSTFQNNKNTLLDKINQINAARANQAQNIVSTANTAATNNAYKNAQLNLSYARLASTNANRTPVNPAAGYSVKQLSSGNKAYTGPNGQTNLYQYAAALAGGDPNQTYSIIKQQLQGGSATDKGAYNGLLKLEQQGLPLDQIIGRLKASNGYIFN